MLFETIAGPRRLRVWLSGVACLFTLLAVSNSAAQEAWPARHHDGMRTGRATGTASISNPTVSWQHSLGTGVAGASVLVADVLGDSTPEYLALVNGAVVARDATSNVVRWDTVPLGVTRFGGVHDFNGDGRPEILLVGRIVVLVDGESGNVVWRATPTDPNVLSFRAPAAIPYNTDNDAEMELIFGHGGRELYLYDFSNGFNDVVPEWMMSDSSLPSSVFRPVIGEFDGDVASQEIAIVNTQSCRIVFVSLADGSLIRRTDPHTSGVFCYGLTQAANVDDDPEDELIFTGNLGRGRGAVTLTVYDFATDAPLWQHEYGTTGVDPRTTLAPAGVVADFDGDGDREIAIAVYDNQDENLGDDDGVNYADGWVVVIYDASDGSTLGTIQDATIHGITDLNNDGTNELLTMTAAPGEATPDEVGTLRAWTLDGDRAPSMLWEVANVSAITRPFPPNPRIQSRDYDRLPAIFNGDSGPDWVLVSTGDDPATVQALDPTGNQVDIAATTQLPGSAGIQLLHEGTDILGAPHVVLRASSGDLTLRNAALTRTNEFVVVGHSSEVLIAPLIDGPGMQVIYRNSSNNIVALDVSAANQLQPPTTLWSVAAGVTGDIVAFDRDNDGNYEVAYAGRLDDDTPFVALIDGDGSELWLRTFPELDRPLFSLTVGQFGGTPGTVDVVGISFVAEGFVPVTYALDGSDGSTISSHQAADVGSSPNRELLLAPNADDDGTDNLLLLHNTTYERLNSDLTPREAAVSFPPSNSRPQNSSLIEQGGEVGVVVKAFRNQLFVSNTTSGSTRWNEQLPPSLLSYVSNSAGFADANGDGTWDVMIPGFLGDVTVYDMLTGAVIYRRCLDGGSSTDLPDAANLETCVPFAPVSSVIVADVDGDGNDEFIAGAADGWLYAINAEDGSTSFSYDLGSQIFHPAVADMDGDGDLEIALTTARSELVMVDHAEISSPTEVRDVELDDVDQIVNGGTDIDITTRTNASGVTWEPVPLATTFLVRLTTENNTDVVASTNVGLTTEHVSTGLNLVAGARYMWHVTAVSDTLGAAPAATTDGFLVTGAGPSLSEELTADPGTFSPGEGDSAAITA
jgi:outer membrane protein assembly factor BamB